MNRKRHNSKGVITILVSLMLVGILSVGTLVIEAGRLQAAKTQLAEATASASTSMIAAFDADLYERYGILAIDTERFEPSRAMNYISFNSDVASGYEGNNLTVMYEVADVDITGLYNLTYPSVLKRQVLSRAKYHVVPQDYALNVYTMDTLFDDFKTKCQYVYDSLAPAANGYAVDSGVDGIDKDTKSALANMYETFKDAEISDSQCDVTLSPLTMNMLPSRSGTVETPIPAEDLDDINSALSDATTVIGGPGLVLGYGVGTPQSEIDVSVDTNIASEITSFLGNVTSTEDLYTKTTNSAYRIRLMANGMISALNMLSSDKEGTLLLNSYIANYFSSRNNRIESYNGPVKGTSGVMDNGSFVSACVEYVFGGDSNERVNQEEAHQYLMAISMINNLYSIISCSSTYDSYDLGSVATHIAWANYESLLDFELQSKYNVAVPVNKNEMIIPINNPGLVKSAFASKSAANALRDLGCYDGTNFFVDGSNKFTYTDALSFALWFVPNSDKMLRLSDLIQIEMRYRQQYVDNEPATFLMKEMNTYCRVKSVAELNPILPIISLDSTNTIRGLDFHTIKYAGY